MPELEFTIAGLFCVSDAFWYVSFFSLSFPTDVGDLAGSPQPDEPLYAPVTNSTSECIAPDYVSVRAGTIYRYFIDISKKSDNWY